MRLLLEKFWHSVPTTRVLLGEKNLQNPLIPPSYHIKKRKHLGKQLTNLAFGGVKERVAQNSFSMEQLNPTELLTFAQCICETKNLLTLLFYCILRGEGCGTRLAVHWVWLVGPFKMSCLLWLLFQPQTKKRLIALTLHTIFWTNRVREPWAPFYSNFASFDAQWFQTSIL